MQLFKISAFFIIAGTVVACGEKKAKHHGAGKGGDDAIASETQEPNVTPVDTGSASELGANLSSGLPDYCQGKVLDSGEFELSCKPRLVPLDRLILVAPGFDPKTDCGHDAKELLCRRRDGTVFKLNLLLEWEEKILSSLPIGLTITRGLLASSVPDAKPEKVMLNKVIDFVGEHKEAIIIGNDIDGTATALASLIKTEWNQANATNLLDDAQVAQIKAGVVDALTLFQKQRRTQQLSLADSMALVTKLIAVIPGDTVSGLLSSLDLSSLLGGMN